MFPVARPELRAHFPAAVADSAVMTVVSFRFYEELNDFLPSPHRKREFACAGISGATVERALEALGVPHDMVELILANGQSVDFSYVVREGDRISVYPVFESLDITPVLKVRAKPLRRTRFIVDARLGGLARYLRVLGFDTRFDTGYTQAQVASLAAEHHRIVLTRDRGWLRQAGVSHRYQVRETRPRKQLEEVVSRLDLYRAIEPLGRCPRCNRKLTPPGRETGDRRRCWTCDRCSRTYGVWHWRRMARIIGGLRRRGRTGRQPSLGCSRDAGNDA